MSERPGWPEGVSDGLTLPCGVCGAAPKFDYRIDDGIWKEFAPEHLRLGVICLPCLDGLAKNSGIILGKYIENVQFIGANYTVVLKPARVVLYSGRNQP